MNENFKKAALSVAVLALVGFATYQGFTYLRDPVEIKHEIGHGIPGHGMKAAEKAEGAAAMKRVSGENSKTEESDPLAGPKGE